MSLPPARRPERSGPQGGRERGRGQKKGAFNPGLAPWAMLCRSFGAEFFNQPPIRDTSLFGIVATLLMHRDHRYYRVSVFRVLGI